MKFESVPLNSILEENYECVLTERYEELYKKIKEELVNTPKMNIHPHKPVF